MREKASFMCLLVTTILCIPYQGVGVHSVVRIRGGMGGMFWSGLYKEMAQLFLLHGSLV